MSQSTSVGLDLDLEGLRGVGLDSSTSTGASLEVVLGTSVDGGLHVAIHQSDETLLGTATQSAELEELDELVDVDFAVAVNVDLGDALLVQLLIPNFGTTEGLADAEELISVNASAAVVVECPEQGCDASLSLRLQWRC